MDDATLHGKQSRSLQSKYHYSKTQHSCFGQAFLFKILCLSLVGGSGYHIPMKGLEEAVLRLVTHVASQEIHRFLSVVKTWDFVPRSSPPSATSSLMEEMMIYLQVKLLFGRIERWIQGVYDMGKQQMPRSSSASVLQAVLHLIGNGYLDILCGTSIVNINEFGFARLLEDLTALEQFTERFSISGLSKDITAPRKLCAFIINWQGFGEDVNQMMQQIPDVSIRNCIAALEKFREVSSWQAQRANRRVSKRKEIDQLLKRLREHVN